MLDTLRPHGTASQKGNPMDILAPAPVEVKPVVIDLDIVIVPDDADDWSDEYVAHLEAEHAADAALDFATEHGFWPC